VPIATTYIFGTLLTANGSMKQLNTMASISMALNIILNLILVPRYQATGAAISSLATQIFAASAQVFIAVKVFGFKVRQQYAVKFFLFLVAIVMLGFLVIVLRQHFLFSWYYYLAIYISVGLLLSVLLKLFSFKGLYEIIRYNT